MAKRTKSKKLLDAAALYLAKIGLRLQYHIPKAPKEKLLAQGPVTAQHILVAMK